jgi:hypothetical protein
MVAHNVITRLCVGGPIDGVRTPIHAVAKSIRFPYFDNTLYRLVNVGGKVDILVHEGFPTEDIPERLIANYRPAGLFTDEPLAGNKKFKYGIINLDNFQSCAYETAEAFNEEQERIAAARVPFLSFEWDNAKNEFVVRPEFEPA